MSDHLQLLRQWLKQCNPNEPIGVRDERYCDLTVQVGDRSVSLRGNDAMIQLADCIELADHSCQLFSGYSGNGKSTELRRLAHRLRQDGYCVLLADAEAYHDLAHPIALSELLIMVAAAFGEETQRETGTSPRKSYWERLLDFLNTEVELEKIKFSGAVAELTFALRHATPFWIQIRDALESRIDRLKKDAHSYVTECIALIEKQHPKGVVFILDSLEKLSGPVTSLQIVLDSVVHVFTQHVEVLRLPGCHVVYTVPPYVGLLAQNIVRTYDGRFMHVLPSVKVYERADDRKPFVPGVAAMLALLGKRVPIEQVFADPALAEELVLASGGHVRTLLMLVRDLLTSAASNGLPATAEHVKTVIQLLREQLELSIRPEAVPVLEAIRLTGTVKNVGLSDLSVLARYMSAQVVLCYRNGDGWFEVHPLVRDDVRLRAEQLAAGAAIRSPEPP